MFMCLAICATCACQLVILARKLYLWSRRCISYRSARWERFSWILHYDETTTTLIGFLKLVRYLNLVNARSRESHIRRTHQVKSLLAAIWFCVCLTQIFPGRMRALLSWATIHPYFGGHVLLFHKNGHSKKCYLRTLKNVKMSLKGAHWTLYGAYWPTLRKDLRSHWIRCPVLKLFCTSLCRPRIKKFGDPCCKRIENRGTCCDRFSST